jgi:PPM family protein phosphatase
MTVTTGARLRWAADSHPGLLRENNEDAYACDPNGRFLILADGMGGHLAGEVASRIAVDTVRVVLPTLLSSGLVAGDALSRAVATAHEEVLRSAASDLERAGMGCTLAIVALTGPDETLWALNVGDSRIYWLRGDALTQVSRDHTVLAQARSAGIPLSASQELLADHTLTQAIGCEGYLAPATSHLAWRPGDSLLLCSDGLTDLVPDDRIRAVLRADTDPAVACRALVELALAGGGHDNVTVIVARVCGGGEA